MKDPGPIWSRDRHRQIVVSRDGIAKLALKEGQYNTVIARRGEDLVFLPESFWGSKGYDILRWYVIDDRGLYQPGEQASIKGWLRRETAGPEGDLEGITHGRVSWSLSAAGQTLDEGVVSLSKQGGFDLTLSIPPDVPLGGAYLKIEALDMGAAANATHNHWLQIATFRRPEYEVQMQLPELGFTGDRLEASLTASYYSGGGLADAQATWTVRATPSLYTPPGWSGWSFGRSRGFSWMRTYSPMRGYPMQGSPLATLSGETDAHGVHHLGIQFEGGSPGDPELVQLEGTVTDLNHQAWSTQSTLLLHPAAVYVGLQLDAYFVRAGEPARVSVVLVDPSGQPVVGQVALTFTETRAPAAVSQCDAVTGADGRATCTFPTVRGGVYKVAAEARDKSGRLAHSELGLWVIGLPGEPPPHDLQLKTDELQLIPEREEVLPGQVARILVTAPFLPAHGLMTVYRGGLLSTERFTMTEPTHLLELPIEDGFVPNLEVQVDLIGARARPDPSQDPLEDQKDKVVARAHGWVSLTIPLTHRTLEIEVTPSQAHAQPGEEVALNLSVTREGAPAAGVEIAVMVVDESVLALTGRELPDPLAIFYPLRSPRTVMISSRAMVSLAPPRRSKSLGDFLSTIPAGRSYQSAVQTVPGVGSPVSLRTDFRALALFAPALHTDAAGRATVRFTLPDSLTRYRILAVAADEQHAFGQAESAVTASLPLTVRPSPPRFANLGDQFELSFILQNQRDRALDVELGVRATNLRFVDRIGPSLPDVPDQALSSTAVAVTIPPNDRVEVHLPVATIMAGTARIQAVARGKDEASTLTDATSFDLPVFTPATTEAFATCGEITKQRLVQPVLAPRDAWPQFGELELTTSSTQLSALTDAVLYLQSYPYEGNEPLASRILAIASLRDVLSAFASPSLPSKDEIEAAVQRDLLELASRQRSGGGFSPWRTDGEVWPFLSIHAAHALARAKAAGYAVPAPALAQSVDFLSKITSWLPERYDQESKWVLRAYALDVLHRMGSPDAAGALALYEEAGPSMGLDGLAWLLPTLHEGGHPEEVEAILRELRNRVSETAETAHFITAYSAGDQLLLHTDFRTDGIALEALLEVDPGSDLVPKLVRGLLAHQTNGRWLNTQENVFALLALDRYFHQNESKTPDFIARAWLGQASLGDHVFQGRTTEQSYRSLPLGLLTEHREGVPLTLARDGEAGRLYYRIALRYAPRSLRLEPADRGFVVERRYVALDDEDDVRRDRNGVWHLAAGARIRVELTMASSSQRYHVALVDPLPAGLEPLNPLFATTASLPPLEPLQSGFWRFYSWWQHDEMRDDRVEAATSWLPEGMYRYSYAARATTRGRFVVPPTKALETYNPETFGRTGTDIVVVE